MKFLFVFLILSHAAFGYQHSPHKARHKRGLVRKSRIFLMATPHISYLAEKTPIPISYSLQNNASPVEDQGQCGSCWDFALTGGLRDTFIGQLGADPGRLSFNYLLNCAKDMYGCNGGDFDAVRHMINRKGPPRYQAYIAQEGKCVRGKPAASAVDAFMLGGSDGPSFKDIAYAVGVLHRPVVTEIAADDSLEDYQGGTFDKCSSQDINHMVLLNGYDCEGACNFDAKGNLSAGRGKFLIKNSWSQAWGQKGYVWIKATDAQGRRCNAVAREGLIYDVKPLKRTWAQRIKDRIRDLWSKYVAH